MPAELNDPVKSPPLAFGASSLQLFLYLGGYVPNADEQSDAFTAWQRSQVAVFVRWLAGPAVDAKCAIGLCLPGATEALASQSLEDCLFSHASGAHGSDELLPRSHLMEHIKTDEDVLVVWVALPASWSRFPSTGSVTARRPRPRGERA